VIELHTALVFPAVVPLVHAPANPSKAAHQEYFVISYKLATVCGSGNAAKIRSPQRWLDSGRRVGILK